MGLSGQASSWYYLLFSTAVDLGTVGAVYPFQGWELVMSVLGILFWLGWHRMQFLAESKELEDAVNSYKGPEATQAIERY